MFWDCEYYGVKITEKNNIFKFHAFGINTAPKSVHIQTSFKSFSLHVSIASRHESFHYRKILQWEYVLVKPRLCLLLMSSVCVRISLHHPIIKYKGTYFLRFIENLHFKILFLPNQLFQTNKQKHANRQVDKHRNCKFWHEYMHSFLFTKPVQFSKQIQRLVILKSCSYPAT